MRNLIVGSAWLSPFALVLLWPYAPIAGMAIMVLSHALWLYAALRANVQWFGPVVTHFAADGRQIWLTIDDGPAEDTAPILDLLGSRGVKATFFVKGKLAAERPDLMRSLTTAGHNVANHSHTHPSATFWYLPPALIAAEIDECNAVLDAPWNAGDLAGWSAVRRAGGAPAGQRPAVPWFRAPVGMKNPSVHPALDERGMRLIGWTVRGFDSVIRDPERVATRIVPRVKPGAIVVMHQGRPHSVACIERVIDNLQRAGYSFVIPPEDRLKTNR